MKLYFLLPEIFVVLLILSLLQTPVADWRATGLNLCNSRADMSVYRFYARNSGPLFGALASVQQRSFGSCAALTPGPCAPVAPGLGPQRIPVRWRGGPPPRIPSLEERLDDHQPTGAWE